jgi:hypothetical protein
LFVSVAVEPELLRYELAIRGISAVDLAKKARLSPATISSALAGRPIAEASLRLIVVELSKTAVDEVIVRLLGRPLGSPQIAAAADHPASDEKP